MKIWTTYDFPVPFYIKESSTATWSKKHSLESVIENDKDVKGACPISVSQLLAASPPPAPSLGFLTLPSRSISMEERWEGRKGPTGLLCYEFSCPRSPLPLGIFLRLLFCWSFSVLEKKNKNPTMACFQTHAIWKCRFFPVQHFSAPLAKQLGEPFSLHSPLVLCACQLEAASVQLSKWIH